MFVRFFREFFNTLCLLFCFSVPFASAATPSATAMCETLTVSLSSNRNYYIFTATGSGTTSTSIAGYRFDFGDHTSYGFTFGASGIQDRTRATVTHTYAQNGLYTVTARVVPASATKVMISPGACQSTVDIGSNISSQPTVLVNTGAGNEQLLFLGAVLIGAVMHHSFFGKRRH